MPTWDKFERAAPETSGVVQTHLASIHKVCQAQNTFLFVRPSTVPTMRLIRAGFATKSMDIHDKSSDWGLTSGFVPCDQAFSKNQSNPPNPAIHPHGHGAALPVHLQFTTAQFMELWGAQHFEHTQEVPVVAAPCFTSADYRHFHSTKNSNVCFLLHKVSGKVFWIYRQAQAQRAPVEVWVWGYGGVPVTGDYDLWMVAPHISKVRDNQGVNSVKDEHGRSAATKFTTDLMVHLNRECGRTDKPVFNHGAEAQNYSFTQALDKRLAVFTPGTMYPFMITRALLPGILHDLLRHGYAAVRNPKWLHGSTLGIEDMADAEKLFPDDRSVQAGVKAKNALRNAAATAIQRAYRKGKDSPEETALAMRVMFGEEKYPETGEEWHKRYKELAPMRALGNMPDDQGADLVLPPQAFPPSAASVYYQKNKKTNPFAVLALIEDENEAQEARSFGQKQEARFGRKGFVQEDGHVVPVDATKKLKK